MTTTVPDGDDSVLASGPSHEPRRRRPALAAEVRAWALTAVAVAALGVPAAAVWYAVAPRVLWRVAEGGGIPVDLGTQSFVADDGWFFVVTAVAGVLSGVAAWAFGRTRATAVAVGLAFGGLAAAVITWRLGTDFGAGGFHHALRVDPTGRTLRGPLTLRAKGNLVVWPIAALVGLIVGVAYESATTRPDHAGARTQPVPYGQPIPDRMRDDAG